tara:strand:+ start:19 stop:1149 length:1131 start_codon:yes stop_codon:yes gene_type:complete
MKYKIHHALLFLYAMLIVGCAPVPVWPDYNPAYNKDALSPAESPKVLILNPVVEAEFFEADFYEVEFLLGKVGLKQEDSDVDNLKTQTEVKRIQKDSESIMHQYMDFFEIDYTPYDKLDSATFSISESTLADIQQFTFPLDFMAMTEPNNNRFTSRYLAPETIEDLAPETIEDLAKFNANYVLSVNLRANYPNSYVIANDSPNASIDSRMVLFNAKTGVVAWHNDIRMPNRRDSTLPRIDLDSIRWGWQLAELASLGILTGKSGPIISKEENSTLKLECLRVQKKKKHPGFSYSHSQFNLAINTDIKMANYKSNYHLETIILKVRQTADNLLLDTAFGDMLSINTSDYSGEWIRENTKWKFTCSETSSKSIQSDKG